MKTYDEICEILDNASFRYPGDEQSISHRLNRGEAIELDSVLEFLLNAPPPNGMAYHLLEMWDQVSPPRIKVRNSPFYIPGDGRKLEDKFNELRIEHGQTLYGKLRDNVLAYLGNTIPADLFDDFNTLRNANPRISESELENEIYKIVDIFDYIHYLLSLQDELREAQDKGYFKKENASKS